MTKASIQQFSTTAASNTDINGINVNVGWPPGNVGSSYRQLMAFLASALVPQQISLTGLTSLTLTAQQASSSFIQFTGTPAGTCTVTLPNAVFFGWANNATAGGFSVNLTAGVGTSVTLPPGVTWYWYACDSVTDVVLPTAGFGSVIAESLQTTSQRVTTNTTLTAQQSGQFIILLPGAPMTLTLPAPSGNAGVWYTLQLTNSVAVTLTTPSGLIEGYTGNATTSQTLKYLSGSATNFIVYTDGFNWGLTGLVSPQATGFVPFGLPAAGTLQGYYVAGSVVGSITTNGATASFNTSSDIRLKANVSPAGDSGPLIDALDVVQFDWKADGGHVRWGGVAQQIDAVFPEAVTQGDTWQVDWSKLVPVLLKEVQDLRARIAALEARP